MLSPLPTACCQVSADLFPLSPSVPESTGTLKVELLNDDVGTFSWSLEFTGISALTRAHIHYGGPTESGEVAVVLLPVGAILVS